MATSATKTLDQWKDEIDSRIALEELVANYCHSIDKNNEDLFRSIWHEDAQWIVAGNPPLIGLDAIMANFRGFATSGRQLRHFTTNLVLRISGDHAEGLSDLYAAHALADGTPRTQVGSYEDIYERRAGHW